MIAPRDCPPDVFARLVALMGRGPSRPVRVTGPLDLKGIQIDVPITFQDVQFAGPVTADSAVFKGYVQFMNCTFEAGADFETATVAGSLVFQGCTFGPASVMGGSIDLRLDHVVVNGRLDLGNCTLAGALSAKHIEVQGKVELASTRIGMDREKPLAPAVDFSGAHFHSDLLLNGSSTKSIADDFNPSPSRQTAINGPIQAHRMTVGGDIVATALPEHSNDTPLATSLEMDGSTIGGLRLSRLHFDGQITGRNMTVLGDVSIAGHLRRGKKAVLCSKLDLTGSEVSNLRLRAFAIDSKFGSGDLTLHSIRSAGMLDIAQVKVEGELSLYGGKALNIQLMSVQTGGDLNAGLVQCTGIFRISDCEIGAVGDRHPIELSVARIDGQLDIQETKCGNIMLNGSHCGSFVIGANEKDGVSCTALHVVSSEFTSYVRILNLTVEADTADPKLDTAYTGVLFEGCTFAADVAFWREYRYGLGETSGKSERIETGFTDHCRSTKIDSELRLVYCDIKGDLDLTRVTMTSGAEGKISIDQCTIGGALRFCSPESFGNRRRITERVRASARAIAVKRADGETDWLPATAASLRLAGSTMLSVDLTGLRLMEDPTRPQLAGETTSHAESPDVPLSLPTGSIDARQITVRRRFAIYDRFEQENWVSATDIPGALWLDEADIGELVIASPSFTKGPNVSVRQDGIVLERAVIRHLKVPRLPHGEGETGFPVPMALGGADIRSFSFRMDDSNGGKEKASKPDGREAQDYVALLESDTELRRELYRSVYRQFRDVGNTRAALQMVVAEGYRTFRQPRGKWKVGAALGPTWYSHIGLSKVVNLIGEGFARLWNLIFGTLFRYGASPMPMVAVGILLFFISLFGVAVDSRNFEVSGAVREVLGRNGVSVVALVGPGLEGREAVADRVIALDHIALGYDVCDDGVVLGPAPDQWGVWEAVWVTTRYHVPIIGMSAVSEFEPTNDRSLAFAGIGAKTECRTAQAGLSLANPDIPRGSPWFTAETWFTLMSILSWIIWPLVLTFVIRRLIRD